eukprot:TRINITY_DN755_c0_g1_i1.p1 TRINITY_DN755_c0_g1~~TRINITY_DN755_c0_g1_i1.p1  ORF type:complete len:517 (-),score=84.11 TRINITY_DN755_c0_g1_i1:1072-2622(-)
MYSSSFSSESGSYDYSTDSYDEDSFEYKLDVDYNLPLIKEEELVRVEMISKKMDSSSVVWKGICRQQEVAIKSFDYQLDSRKDVTQFLNECNMFLSVGGHQNIVMLMGVSTSNNLAVIMEYVPGGDLENYLVKNPDLDIYHKLKMMKDIAKALCWLHDRENPIIHRNLKPKNILVGEKSILKITDFGLSFMMNERDIHTSESFSPIYYAWMPPELLSHGGSNDMRIDIYSFAMVSWQILSGQQNPFSNTSSKQKLYNYIVEKRQRPSMPTCNQYLASLITECWDHRIERRPHAKNICKRLDICFVYCTIPNEEAAEFWYHYFRTDTQVTWNKFIVGLLRYLKRTISCASPKFKIMKHFLVQKRNVVKLKRFARIVSWFGKLSITNGMDIVDRIHKIVSKEWFFGEISSLDAMAYFNSKKKRLLVRLNFTRKPISQYPYTVTYCSPQTGIRHIRISYDSNENTYELSFQNVNESFQEIQEVVQFLYNRFHLKPVSKFPRIYSEFLVEDVAENLENYT